MAIMKPANLIASIGLLWSAGLQTHSQQTSEAPPGTVLISCSVVDKQGQPVDNLQAEDFEVYEDGILQKVAYFSREFGASAPPSRIVMLVDISNSAREKLPLEQKAAREFLVNHLRPQDEAAIIGFGSQVYLTQDFTSEISRLEQGLDALAPAGATKLYDAIYLATQKLLAVQEERRILMIFSDGRDTNSRTKVTEVLRLIRKHGLLVFAVGVSPRDFRRDFTALKEFVRESGGLFVRARQETENLRQALETIRREIQHRYSIGFVSSSAKPSDKPRRLKLKLKRKGLTVRHRQRFYE